MAPITSSETLKEAIAVLELQRKEQLVQLTANLHIVMESLRPGSLLKNALHEVSTPLELNKNFVDTSIGLTAGYLSEKLLIGKTSNPIKMLLGTALKFAVTNVVTRNPGLIKSIGIGLFKRITRRNRQDGSSK
jgi:hypothetical protein